MYIKKGKAPYWMSKIRQSQAARNCKENCNLWDSCETPSADKLSPGPSHFSNPPSSQGPHTCLPLQDAKWPPQFVYAGDRENNTLALRAQFWTLNFYHAIVCSRRSESYFFRASFYSILYQQQQIAEKKIGHVQLQFLGKRNIQSGNSAASGCRSFANKHAPTNTHNKYCLCSR